jgi:hypothetical protein
VTQTLAPLPMTQAQQEAELRALRSILARVAPGIRADRCRHESVEYAALHLFDGESQIGAASIDGTMWRCSAMHRGMPTSCRWFPILDDCVAHILERANVNRRAA